jgi:eukaryotic-like serine/threonine-protein kinase
VSVTDSVGSCPSCSVALQPGVHFCPNCGTPTPTEPGVPARTMPTGAIEVSRIRTALADRYRIERVLGEGGMATVYLAEDLKHRRKVAVKVMRPELAATLGSDRFLREVEIAAKLSHPNILPVYDSGEAQGVLYYVMPLVEGLSLPDRLKREKQLPVGDALRIAREVADALAYAHARGVVHRDIKPANILINAGHAMVADFGIARAAGNEALTQTGLAIGTPHYMSPEQSSGDANVDGRTDIYALGCVLYEMLAGEPPFTGPTAQAIIARSMSDAPRPLQQTRASLAPAIGNAVMTALAKAPADRYATATDMASALTVAEDLSRFGSGATTVPPPPKLGARWPLVAAAVVVMTLALAGWRWFAGRGAGNTAAKSVAVLPFQNQGPTDQAYFADGIVDELRDKLARLDQLTVTASSSSDQYRSTTKTGLQIASELRVDQVLMGKVSWGRGASGERRVRVVAELVNGRTGAVTWRETFDADSSEAFDIQGRIATGVASALGTALQKAGARDLAGRPTRNAEAYDLFLKGRAYLSNSASDRRAAANYFEQAVALDSNFAQAWGRLTVSLSLLYANGSRDPAVGRRAGEALKQMLRLADDSASSHAAAAVYYTNVMRDPIAMRRELSRALAIDSNNVFALTSSAQADLDAGNYRATLAKLSRARQLDPRSTGVLVNLTRAQIALGRADEAVATADELMALGPTEYNQMQWIIFAHLAGGDSARARRVVQEFLARVPASELVPYFAGYQELAFILGDKERDLLYRMTPAAFDNDRAWWAQSLATAYWQQGDALHARAYADSSLVLSKQQSDANPQDPQLRALYAVMLAYAGHAAEATREAEQALASATSSRDPNVPYVRLQAIRTYLATGNNGKALDALQQLLTDVSYVTRGYLKVDPTFKPLRGNPRFEQMLLPGITLPAAE